MVLFWLGIARVQGISLFSHVLLAGESEHFQRNPNGPHHDAALTTFVQKRLQANSVTMHFLCILLSSDHSLTYCTRALSAPAIVIKLRPRSFPSSKACAS